MLLLIISPVDVSSDMQKVSYSQIHNDATLSCNVRANPVIIESGVIIRHNQTLIKSDVSVQAVNTMTDETLIEVKFKPVLAEDFGIYEVVVINKVGQQMIQLILVENGKRYSLNINLA